MSPAAPFIAASGFFLGSFAADPPADAYEWLTGLGPYAAAAISVWWMLRRSDAREEMATASRRADDELMRRELSQSHKENHDLRARVEQLLIDLGDCHAEVARLQAKRRDEG